MMYATLLAQAVLIASVILSSAPIATRERIEPRTSLRVPAALPAASESLIARENGKLRCRLYFGCAPATRIAGEPTSDK